MAPRNAKLMALYPHRGNFRAPNISYPFYFHVPGPYNVNTGDAIVSENNIVSHGGVAVPSGRSLMTVSWNSLFHIAEYDLFYGGQDPRFIMPPPGSSFRFDDAFDSIRLLKTMKEKNQVAQLLIRDRALGGEDDINMNVILTNFTYEERDGEPDCRYYSVTFKEFKPLRIRQVPASNPNPGTGINPRPDKYGRYVPARWKLPKEMGMQEICKVAYHRISTRLRKRLLKANGGYPWLSYLMRQGKCRRDTKQRYGPWFIAKGVVVYIPPKTGKLYPNGGKPPTYSSGASNRLAPDER